MQFVQSIFPLVVSAIDMIVVYIIIGFAINVGWSLGSKVTNKFKKRGK